MVKPKKYLGQHFLKDKNIAKKIVNSIDLSLSKNVIEIGPGTGVLTDFLISMPISKLTLIEIDKESVDFLKEKYESNCPEIIWGDFLKNNEILNEESIIIGNFPYNISSQIFFKILENRNKVIQVTGMIQKEVAERIKSSHGNKTYGILSVLIQAYYDIEYLFTVNETVFQPPPKVKSAVIRLTRKSNLNLNCDEDLFKKIVKASFNQRRKTIRNSLKLLISGREVGEVELPLFSLRPEQLSVSDFVFLTQTISRINTE